MVQVKRSSRFFCFNQDDRLAVLTDNVVYLLALLYADIRDELRYHLVWIPNVIPE